MNATARVPGPEPTPPAGGAPAPAAVKPAVSPRAPAVWCSTDLFGDAQEILIEHQSQLYRLRRTSLGKLILTK
ncbi:MAG: hemin uptake protein HemP [Ideonella sp.]|nr:hemin uptake protein HemP [Ideonella sp.]